MKSTLLTIVLFFIVTFNVDVVFAAFQKNKPHVVLFGIESCICEDAELIARDLERLKEDLDKKVREKVLSPEEAKALFFKETTTFKNRYLDAVREKIEFDNETDYLVEDVDSNVLLAIASRETSRELAQLQDRIASRSEFCKERAEQQKQQ